MKNLILSNYELFETTEGFLECKDCFLNDRCEKQFLECPANFISDKLNKNNEMDFMHPNNCEKHNWDILSESEKNEFMNGLIYANSIFNELDDQIK